MSVEINQNGDSVNWIHNNSSSSMTSQMMTSSAATSSMTSSAPSAAKPTSPATPQQLHENILAEIKAGGSLQRNKQNTTISAVKKVNVDINTNDYTPGKVYDAKDVIDQIPKVDESGRPIPDWKRQILARKAAEQATKDAEVAFQKQKDQEKVNKYKGLPAWKADLLRKKDEAAEQVKREEEERQRRLEEERKEAARLERERKKQQYSRGGGALKPWEQEILAAREARM
ncbi:espin-like [Ptychodera flava]|uniref:espin-like n=1 Tax=Ptychodera flava TaxID=63121 RepID=UPI003969F08C